MKPRMLQGLTNHRKNSSPYIAIWKLLAPPHERKKCQKVSEENKFNFLSVGRYNMLSKVFCMGEQFLYITADTTLIFHSNL